MKLFLVGGAVRDEALRLKVTERDWLVVGGTEDELVQRGFRRVGRDFPVFLHPTTHEEYALARTERKVGPGYRGFVVDFNQGVTLEEDLVRRDLTINAMAVDDTGQLHDPFHGMRDLEQKVLRHVSPAFVDDPVRVLRVARFAARYARLGFSLAHETRDLIYSMVQQGELAALVPERVWQECVRAWAEPSPEVFFTTLRSAGALQPIFPELHALFGVPNNRQITACVDTGVRALERLAAVVAYASHPRVRFASLCLELGKSATLPQQWPDHEGYERGSCAIIDKLCRRLRVPNDYRDLARLSAILHGDVIAWRALSPHGIVDVFERADAFRRPERFRDVLMVARAYADVQQAVVFDGDDVTYWQHLLAACRDVTLASSPSTPASGELIRQMMHQQRVMVVTVALNKRVFNEK